MCRGFAWRNYSHCLFPAVKIIFLICQEVIRAGGVGKYTGLEETYFKVHQHLKQVDVNNISKVIVFWSKCTILLLNLQMQVKKKKRVLPLQP